MPPPRDDECRFTGTPGRPAGKVRLAEVAESQFGRVRWDQILAAGASERTLRRWVQDGYLHRVLPRVYAVGHTAESIDAALSAALLYAGPGAMLSHVSAVWWWGLLDHPPEPIHVSTSRAVGSLSGITAHPRRRLARLERHGLPVTTVHQALLDFAVTAPRERLRFVLANADYRGLLDLPALDALTGRGVAGTVALRNALKAHRPELAHTRSGLERLLLALCEEHDLPLPRVNVTRHGRVLDALWFEQGVVVELDGLAGHRSRAQLERDHRRDLELRAAGYLVLRYTWRQLTETPDQVIADLVRHLSDERRSAVG